MSTNVSRCFVRSVLKLKFLIVSAVALSAALAFAGAGRADSDDLAVAFQINVAHSGVQTDSELRLPFERRWQVRFPATVSYPLIAEGKVFVTVGDNGTPTRLYGLDQATGQVLWSQLLPAVYPWANAAYDGGRVFVVTNNAYCCPGSGMMRAFDADTGDLVWASQLPAQYMFTSPPTAAGGVVYTSGTGNAGTLYAVRESDGQLLATQTGLIGGDHSAPALSASGGLFVSYACNQAYAFKQFTLEPLWHYAPPCEGGGGKTTVYAGGRVYTRDFFGDLILDAETGTLIRNYGPTRSTGYAPAVDSSAIFRTFPGSMLTAQSLDGTPLWTFSGDGLLNTPPLVLNGGSGRLLIVGSWSGRLYALDPASGREVWSTDVGTGISGAGESGLSEPQAGMGIGQGLIVVPARNTVSAYGTDNTAPTITVPTTIITRATSSAGAIVTYAAFATDPDGTATLTCSPASGSLFPIGATTVRCTATDAVGNRAGSSFLVVVSAPNANCDLSQYPLTKGALNLKNANLSGCYFAGANLSGASASNANLANAYLDGANLSSATLSQAILKQAVLTNANLSGANLGSANLTGASLALANLGGANWNQTICPDGTNSNNNASTCVGHLG